jgi:hypothetical protein
VSPQGIRLPGDARVVVALATDAAEAAEGAGASDEAGRAGAAADAAGAADETIADAADAADADADADADGVGSPVARSCERLHAPSASTTKALPALRTKVALTLSAARRA